MVGIIIIIIIITSIRHGGNLSILKPLSTGSGAGRWQMSDFLSALHTLSAVTYTKALMSSECKLQFIIPNSIPILLSLSPNVSPTISVATSLSFDNICRFP